MSEDVSKLLYEIDRSKFIRELSTIQKLYPPGTQFNLFPHLGYQNELIIRRWDAQRVAHRWGCPLEDFARHLTIILNKDLEFLRHYRHARNLRALISNAIVRYVKSELKTDLYTKYNEPTDRKLTKQLRDYIRNFPKGQQEVIVLVR